MYHPCFTQELDFSLWARFSLAIKTVSVGTTYVYMVVVSQGQTRLFGPYLVGRPTQWASSQPWYMGDLVTSLFSYCFKQHILFHLLPWVSSFSKNPHWECYSVGVLVFLRIYAPYFDGGEIRKYYFEVLFGLMNHKSYTPSCLSHVKSPATLIHIDTYGSALLWYIGRCRMSYIQNSLLRCVPSPCSVQ